MWYHKLREQRGQALVEFALILPIFILLLLGMVNFGFILSGQLIVTHAAREGARLMAVTAIKPDTVYPTKTNLEVKVEDNSFYLDTVVNGTVYENGTRTQNKWVNVTVSADVDVFAPGLNLFLTNPFHITDTVQMRVE